LRRGVQIINQRRSLCVSMGWPTVWERKEFAPTLLSKVLLKPSTTSYSSAVYEVASRWRSRFEKDRAFVSLISNIDEGEREGENC
jgi:hypothetical protein